MLKTQRVLALLAIAAAGSLAHGATIAFSGAGTSGSINPNSLPWLLTPNDSSLGDPFFRNVSVWGVPGLSLSAATWPAGNGNAVAFTVSFATLPGGISIDQTPDPTPTAIDDYTRFHNSNDTVVWIPSYLGGNSVTFTAPAGYTMPAGTMFYLNVAFTGGTVSFVNFAGDWTTAPTAMPEPGYLSLVALVLVSAALFARRRVLN